MADEFEYWKPVLFKGKRVYARSTSDGDWIVDKALVQIRYSLSPGKTYSASERNLVPIDEPPTPRPVGETTSSDPKPKGQKTHKSPPLPRPGAIVAYTDGACSGNPGPAGYGVLLINGAVQMEISGYLGEGTNNIAELEAIGSALVTVGTSVGPFDLYTDSSYAIGVLTKGWKAKANQDLIARIKRTLPDHPNLTFHWVKGHAGFAGNEKADELARKAIETQSTVTTQTAVGDGREEKVSL